MAAQQGKHSDRPYSGRKQDIRKPPATTRFFNELGRRVAYFYVRRLMRSDVEWETDLPLGAKIIAANHPTTTDPFLMMSWPFEPVYILISEAAFKVPLIGPFLRLAGHIPVYPHRGREAFEAAIHLLGEGKTVGIFPEGALSEDDGHLVTPRSGQVGRNGTSTDCPGRHCAGLAFRHHAAVAAIRGNRADAVVLAWSV